MIQLITIFETRIFSLDYFQAITKQYLYFKKKNFLSKFINQKGEENFY
jgi:hypothetical protein